MNPAADEPESLYVWHGPPQIRLSRQRVQRDDGVAYLTHQLQVGSGRPGVVVLPRDGTSLLLIRIWRHAVGRELLELVRGVGESPEPSPDGPCADALRELREETGLSGSAPRVLGQYVTDSAVFPNPVSVVECQVSRRSSPVATDGEAKGLLWVQEDDLPGLVRDGALCDSHSLGALAIAAAFAQRRPATGRRA